MPRSADYYAQRLQNPAGIPSVSASSSTPKFSTSPYNTQTPEQKAQKFQAEANQWNEVANSSLVNRLDYAAGELISGIAKKQMPDDLTWKNMGFLEKQAYKAKAMMGATYNMIKSAPAEIAKAPLRISNSLFDFVDRGMVATGLVDKEVSEKYGMPEKYDLPVLGEVGSYGASYKEGRAIGMNRFWSTVKAGSEAAGDVAIGLSMMSAIDQSLKPRLTTLETKTGEGPTFTKLKPKEINQMKVRLKKLVGPKSKTALAQGEVIEMVNDPTPNINYIRMPKNITAQYKGNPNNTFLKISDAGNGMREVSVVQLRNSILKRGVDAVKNKFGSKVVTGKFGPEIKLNTAFVEPGLLTEGEMATAARTNALALTGESAPVASAEKAALAGVEEATGLAAAGEAAGVGTMKGAPAIGKPIPEIMRSPIKGYSDKLVTDEQIGQIKHVQELSGIDDDMARAISKVVNGKENLYELTQEEAYEVSEAVRGFTKNTETIPADDSAYIKRSLTQPARYWMESAERELGVPIYSDGYLPVELGARMKKVYTNRWQGSARETFGEYAKPKYVDERKAITQYLEGNKAIIENNPAFSAKTKAELVEISQWLQEQYKDLFKDLGIKSERFFGEYSPRIRERGGIYNMYKNEEMPREVDAFYRYEREGMMMPLEEDALALFDIYTNMAGKEKFVKKPVERAQGIIDQSPRNIKDAAQDYLDEKIGLEDKMSEYMTKLGEKMSDKSGGLLPKDLTKQTMDFLMTNTYAGALGLPRIMPIFRNFAQPFITTYPEVGEKWLATGIKRFLDKGGIDAVRDRGLLVEMGVPYGGELARAAGKSKVGKGLDMYKKVGQTMMKPYAGVDVFNRGVTYHAAKARFDHFHDLFKAGKIDFNTFTSEINLDGYSPTLQKVVTEKLIENTPESTLEASEMLITDLIDRTQFPYRKGAEGRLFYGMKGKLGLQFGQWGTEYFYTLTKAWIGRKQWPKLIRWMAASSTIKRSMEESFGVDVSKWVGLEPFSGIPLGPVAQIGARFTEMMNNTIAGFSDEVNDNFQEIKNTLKIFGGTLTGVGAQRLKKFWQSVDRADAGVAVSPDPSKPYGVWSKAGKLIRWVDGAELLKNLMGFDTPEEGEMDEKIKNIKKDDAQYQERVQKAMNYLVDGDVEKFDEYVTKHSIIIKDIGQKMKSYTVPLDQRIYNTMPLQLKIKYNSVFYPD